MIKLRAPWGMFASVTTVYLLSINVENLYTIFFKKLDVIYHNYSTDMCAYSTYIFNQIIKTHCCTKSHNVLTYSNGATHRMYP